MSLQTAKVFVGVVLGVAVFAAGYVVPPIVWTRDQAAAAISFGTLIARGNLTLGNSRIPCRGPNRAAYVFGYAFGVTNNDWPTGGSGSVCWDIFNGKWDWRVDQPYDYLSSDRSLEARSGIR